MEPRTAAVIRKEIEDLENLMKGARILKILYIGQKYRTLSAAKQDMIFFIFNINLFSKPLRDW